MQSVTLHGATPLEQELGVVLCVTNPNADALEFRGVRVALDAAGAPLLDGTRDTAIRLPPRASIAVPFTVVTTARNIPLQLAAVFQAGQGLLDRPAPSAPSGRCPALA